MSEISNKTTSKDSSLDKKFNDILNKDIKTENKINISETSNINLQTDDIHLSEKNISIKKRNICSKNDCKKKLKLTDIACRCGFKFCSIHRYAEKHECTFDWKKKGRNELTNNNPIVIADKVNKI